MKPLTLREPAPCCGTPTLVWLKDKHFFQCPCGTMQVNIDGRPRQKRPFNNHNFGKKTKNHGRPTKG